MTIPLVILPEQILWSSLVLAVALLTMAFGMPALI